MKIIKTSILGLLLLIVVVTIYLNNLSTVVTNPPEDYKGCNLYYYHPQFTYIPRYRKSPVNDKFWITTDDQVISRLVAMPGMKVTLDVSDNNIYMLMFSDTQNGGVGTELSKQEAEFLMTNIPDLEENGNSVEITDYIGYIDDELMLIDKQDMLGNASSCKEQK